MRIGNIQYGAYSRDEGAHASLTTSAWIEILLLTGLAASLYTISQYFSEWPALSAIPLACIALRHGSSPAVLASLIWILMCSLVQKSMGQMPEPLAMTYLGPILVALLCGFFSDYWSESQTATDSAREHDALLLEQITQSHHLLQLSHARLEQRVVGGVDTLRESLQRLHSSLIRNAQQELPLASRGADMLLQFDSLTWIQSASLHMVSSDDRVMQKAAAEIGDPPPLAVDLGLVSEAVAQRKMLAVMDVRSAMQQKGPLAVAPIVDNDSHVRAIVCVHKVPFLSFNRENLALMAVLAAHIGHIISTTERNGAPDNQQVFEHAIKRACEDASTFGLPSTLVQWTFHPSQMASNTAEFLRDNVRGLDHPLLQNHEGVKRLTLLCSLTDRGDFDSMLTRVQQLLATRHAIELKSNISSFKMHAINAQDRPEVLMQMMGLKSYG